MRSQAVKGALGDKGDMNVRIPGVRKGKDNKSEDMFQLQPLPETEEAE